MMTVRCSSSSHGSSSLQPRWRSCSTFPKARRAAACTEPGPSFATISTGRSRRPVPIPTVLSTLREIPPWRFVMTDPDRYDLDLLEPLGAVAPPASEVLNRIAASLHARYLHDVTSGVRPATSIGPRTRLAIPVTAAATAVAAILA